MALRDFLILLALVNIVCDSSVDDDEPISDNKQQIKYDAILQKQKEKWNAEPQKR